MFLTPKSSSVHLQGIYLPVNLISNIFSSIFFLKAVSNPICSKMSPLYYIYFILHEPMANVLTDNENLGQL